MFKITKFYYSQKYRLDAIVIPHLFGLPNKLQNINKKNVKIVANLLGQKLIKPMLALMEDLEFFLLSLQNYLHPEDKAAKFCNYMQDAEKIREFINYDMKSNLKSGFNFIMTI